MATSGFFIPEDLLECSICVHVYIDNDPRILSCQHTFCFKCLEKLAGGKTCIPCPECRQSYQIPNNDVKKIPKNLTCMKIMNGISVHKNVCKKHGQEGSLFCLNHNESNICSDCFFDCHLDCKVKPSKYREKKLMISC